MQRFIFRIIIVQLLILSTSCKDDPKIEQNSNVEVPISTFYFIRHAEKDRSDPEDVDPELNQKGLGRAMHWAEVLRDVRLNAIYTTDFERTAMTAAPASVKNDITVQYYDPETINVEQFKADNLGNTVLVVGHSNTTPNLVNQMIGEDVFSEMDDSDNGSLFIVQVINGKAIPQRLHLDCNCLE
ncbi:phosphoglycerate mutase family protein [Pricia sp. S334]|uniref:Phosphoglycerate mutase family protein n=1 Tax=Pricia mediterranea TaxID=3076079 RepID=A0ABU3LBV5_9FLAO|nr:phosphoglycerate mutase family protein [Pricia sp. S334]MDT7830679.1 phosphoglycerate mutase family protein [Pricia sp. S334]